MTIKAQRRIKKRIRRLFSEIRKRLRRGKPCDAAVLYARLTGQFVERRGLAVAAKEEAEGDFVVGLFANGGGRCLPSAGCDDNHQGSGGGEREV